MIQSPLTPGIRGASRLESLIEELATINERLKHMADTATIQDAIAAFKNGTWSPSWSGVPDIIEKNEAAGTLPSDGQAKAILRTWSQDHNADRKPVPEEPIDEQFECVSYKPDTGKALLVSKKHGYKIWGEPDKDIDIRVGDQVMVRGAVSRSSQDDYFGFYRDCELEVLPRESVDQYPWDDQKHSLPF